MTRETFKADGPIYAGWTVAPCELVTLSDHRLIPIDARPMEYDLIPDKGQHVQLVQWKQHVERKAVNPLRNKCDLIGLSECADGKDQIERLLSWVSRWGLLGFRPARTAPHSFERSITFGTERLFGPGHHIWYGAEPLTMVIEAARKAKVAVRLYNAFRRDSAKERRCELKKIITHDANLQCGPRVRYEPDGSEILTGSREMPTFVGDVYIGMQIEPRIPSQYDHLAVEGLGFLTNSFLGHEFRLCWSQSKDRSKQLALGWTVSSLLAVLYLKLGSALRENRCKICGIPISHRTERARTCGTRCRKRLQRAIDQVPPNNHRKGA